MRLPNLCKPLFFIACSMSLPSLMTATQPTPQDTNSEANIKHIYQYLMNTPASNLTSRIELISAQFLGKPYLLGALGEGENSQYNQLPLYRTDAFDCETYVDTVLALALAHNSTQFKQCINQVRYQNGHVSFLSRNHFTCLDWNQNNQRNGFVKDITTTLHNQQKQPIAQFATAYIDKPSWYTHLSKSVLHLDDLNADEQAARLRSLQQEGKRLPGQKSTIAYIPLSQLFDPSGAPNMVLFKQIPNAAIMEIVRPNWDLTKDIGTHLNISHLGFVFWKNGIPIFREASSVEHKVIDVPLITYLKNTRKNPTIKGINLQIVPGQSKACD